MLETPKYLTILSTYFKTYLTQILIVAVAALSYQGWRSYQKYLVTHQTKLQQENAILQSKIADKTKAYDELKVAKDKLAVDNIKLDEDAQYWKKKASSIPRPPEPPKPPVDDPTLLSNLKGAGAEFKPLQGTLFSTEHSTLPLVWTWNKQALRVPLLEEKLDATEKVALKFENLSSGYKNELTVSNKMLTEAEQHEILRKQQEVNLTEQVKTEHNKVVAAQTNGYLKAGAALVAGYFVGKAVRK
ncbi:MAG: hypothetical protein JHC33_07150 [Ignisphaera sp.]|nr:hypothetical protein [Ignisphaera sp.]